MKVCLIVLFVLTSINVFAARVFFSKEVDDRFNVIEGMSGDVSFSNGVVTIASEAVEESMVQEVNNDGLNLKRVARANHNFANDGGAASTSYPSGVTLPASSIVTNAYFKINSTIVSASDNTVAISCAASNDIYSAADLTDSGTTIILGAVSDSATPVYVFNSSACEIQVETGAGASGLTAGNLTWFIEYDITD